MFMGLIPNPGQLKLPPGAVPEYATSQVCVGLGPLAGRGRTQTLSWVGEGVHTETLVRVCREQGMGTCSHLHPVGGWTSLEVSLPGQFDFGHI